MAEQPHTAHDGHTVADEIVGGLLDAGSPVDEGCFTVDVAQAAAKLERFAHADRSRYLLAIAEGLFGLGASELRVDGRGEDLRVRAPGLVLDDAERLLDICGDALGIGRDPIERALGRLGVGIDMLLGGSGERVLAIHSHGSSQLCVEYRRGVAPQRVDAPGHELVQGVELHLDCALTPDAVEQRRAALDHLLAAVYHSPHVVEVDGERVSGNPREWFEPSTDEGPGYRVCAGIEQVGEEPSAIELWSSGMAIEVIAAPGLGFRAVIELEHPRRDLSQQRVVRDATVEQALAAAEQLRERAIEQLRERAASWDQAQGERPPDWPADRLARILGEDTRAPSKIKRGALQPVGWWQLFTQVGSSAVAFGSAGAVVFGLFLLALALVDPAIGQRDAVWLVALMLELAGVPPLARQAVATNRRRRARDQGLRTHARVSAREPTRVYWSFIDAEGVERHGRSDWMAPPSGLMWEVGEQIVVYHHPAHPQVSCWEFDVGPPRSRLRPSSAELGEGQ